MAEIQAGTLIAGRYQLEARIDAGGKAQVWRATDQELKREVAVKLLVTPPGGDPSFVAAFREEAQVEAGLKHPNIVEVFDWGHDGDANYIVMELLSGYTVRQHLEAEGPMAPALVLGAGRQVASALAYAHQAGVAHGMLSDHVIVVRPDGNATVIGFGLRCRGACEVPPTPDTDTYALGGVLYEMLTGASPFGPRPANVPADHPWPAPVQKLVADTPHDLDHIVMKAISPDPADRYGSAAELQAALDALAKPKSRAWLWILLAVLAVALAAGGAWYFANQQKVVVPDVTGKTQAEATTQLGGVGLKLVVTGNQPSATYAEGTISSETPTPGESIRKGGQVSVTVSTGKPTVAVPSFVGVPLATATTQINAAGLVVGTVDHQNSSTIAVDAVISSSPAAGTQVVVGTSVNLVVSAGQKTVTVPDVRGQSQANATTKMTNAGLQVSIGTAYSSQAAGTVISESPTQGTVVPVGSTVTMQISNGPAPVQVPNVVGASVSDAKTSIQNAGLVPVFTGSAPSTWTISSQTPEGGSSLASGKQVTLTAVHP